MKRPLIFALLVIVLAGAGCGGKPGLVLATFVLPDHPMRLVLYKSGVYELHRAEDGVPERPYKRSKKYHFRSGRLEAYMPRPPVEAGTYFTTPTNLVVAVDQAYLASPAQPARRVYRILLHDGVEYLFDERLGWAQEYEETGDTNALRHAWRQERR